jgi:uncharacterized membrane protein
MHANARTFMSVLISGFIVWSILNYSGVYRMPWWGFLFILCVTFLVIDATLQALQERIAATR